MNLAKLFGRGKKGDIPRDIAKLLERHDDPEKMLEGIDRLLTENQVRLEKVRREAFGLEGTRAAEIAKIEGGELSDRMEALVLDQIGRIETRLDAIEGEMGILTRNIQALTSLEGKIREARAMALKGFTEEQIEEILLNHGEKKDEYLQAVSATDIDAEYDPIKVEQEEKRQSLKERILAQKKERDEKKLISEEELGESPQVLPAADEPVTEEAGEDEGAILE